MNALVRGAFKLSTNLHKNVAAVKPAFPNILQCRPFATKKHKWMIKMAKGYRGRANRCFTVAKQRVHKAMQRMFIGRKQRKRDFRKLWIQRINAGARIYGVTYSSLIYGLSFTKICLNRKVLADMAFNEPLSFRAVIEATRTRGIHHLEEKRARLTLEARQKAALRPKKPIQRGILGV